MGRKKRSVSNALQESISQVSLKDFGELLDEIENEEDNFSDEDDGIAYAFSDYAETELGDEDSPFDWSTPTDLALRQAASFVDDARANRREMHMIDPRSLQLYYLYHTNWVRFAIRLMLILQVFVNPIFENPQTIAVPLWLPAITELIAVFVYASTMLLRFSFLVPGAMMCTRQIAAKNFAFLICNVLITVDIIMWFITYYSLGWGVRWSRILRPYIVVYYIKPIRLALYTIFKMLPKLAEIFFLIASVILIYSLISYLVFLDSEQGKQYMSTYWHTLISFYVLMTTANFPDVMMPAYSENHWTCLIFISFLVLVTYFLLNMVLALIFKTYSELMRRKLAKIVLFERKRIYFAYSLLDPSESGGIPFNTWRRFVKKLKPKYSTAKSAFLFRLINTSRSGEISVEEFVSILTILQMTIYKSRKTPNIIQRVAPKLYTSKYVKFLRMFVLSK